ncbi:hypothetical protein [Nocardioides terrisoli]|uniref:hypothetical protein n=1 Tax=Nocardioides terrisoli TaxID=3388267 RepID=UPI00287B7E0B|nr:hypothetical protein [Nocardioides marmorisolisilvae]
MASSRNNSDRASQQDARAWSALTGTKYTASLRQVESPFAQGFLGDRFSVRTLVGVLDDHPVVGSHGGPPVLGDNGMWDTTPWRFGTKKDLVEMALVVEALRLFTPATEADAAVHSYRLKHTVEKLLAPHCNYVTNGRLIWAAAALGLPLVETETPGPNLLVGISEAEHDYVRQLVDGSTPPTAHHHRPAALDHLEESLARCAAGTPVAPRWVRPAPVVVATPFHDWLIAQADRNDRVGDIARDYVGGIEYNIQSICASGGDFLEELVASWPSANAYDAAVHTIAEWFMASPDADPVRPKFVSRSSDDVSGWGAGAGDMEKVTFLCPCGDGEVVEEHDNVPGFREHSVNLWCDRCRGEWDFAPGRSVRDWGLIPLASVPQP